MNFPSVATILDSLREEKESKDKIAQELGSKRVSPNPGKEEITSMLEKKIPVLDKDIPPLGEEDPQIHPNPEERIRQLKTLLNKYKKVAKRRKFP